MAANLLPVQPFGATASIPRSSDHLRRRGSASAVAAAANGGSGSWWSPLFGWSSDDSEYIDSSNNSETSNMRKKSQADLVKSEKKSKFTPGCFTEEKARRLRMMTMETETFNEVMYHSAIAARLATDFPRRSGQ